MQVDTSRSNEADLVLEPGEELHYAGKFLRGRYFGLRALPPCPLGSPLARIWHGCYWLNSCRAGEAPRSVRLTGPTVIGRFQAVRLEAGQRAFINASLLAAFSFGPGGNLRTALRQLVSPTMWSLGHPLPMLASGPGTVLVYGEGLCAVEVVAGGEYIPNQVAAFDAQTAFTTRALSPDSGVLSHAANAIGRESRWVFSEATRVFLVPVNRPEAHITRLFKHLVIHGAVLILFLWLFHRS